MNFYENVVIVFKKLTFEGYQIDFIDDYIVALCNESMTISIYYDKYSYEISVYLEIDMLNNEVISISLQDAIEYYSLEKKGSYQMNNNSEISLALKYLFEVVLEILNLLGADKISSIRTIYADILKKQKMLQKTEYVKYNLKSADKFFTQKRYKKSWEIYNYYLPYLSDLQKKKLLYCEKYME